MSANRFHIAWFRSQGRGGFTLVELLIALGILGILAAVILAAISPGKQLGAATDAGRHHAARQLENAQFQYLLDQGAFAGDKSLPAGEANALPVCRAGQTDAGCVNVDALVPTYLPCIPYDGAEANPAYSGYRLHQDVGRVRATAAYVGSGSAQVGCEELSTLTSGLIGLWKMDESSSGATVLDSSGFGRNGTPASNFGTTVAVSTDAPGVSFTNPYSRSFVRSNRTRVAIPALAGPANGFTYATWVKTTLAFTDNARVGMIASMYQGPGGAYFQFWIGENGSVLGRIHQSRDTVSIYRSTPSGLVSAGAWHHVAFTWDGGTTPASIKVYIDGVQRDTTDGSQGTFTQAFTGPVTLWIGAQNCGGSCANAMDGLMDDARIYDRALSADEIADLAAGEQ